MNNWKSDYFIRTGLSHRKVSKGCQDYVLLEGDSRGAALSDGVSRSINPEKAAEHSTHVALEVCKTASQNPKWMQDILKGGEIFKQAAYGLSNEICKKVRERLTDYPKAEATLCFVYMLNERYAVAGYIGDSAIVVISDQNKAQVLSQTRDHGGATESIAHPKAANLLEIRLIDMEADNIKAFVLTTDGLEHEIYLKGKSPRVLKACEDYVNALFMPDSHNLIEGMLDEVTANECFDDDISLAILARDKVSLPDDITWLCTCGCRTRHPNTFCENCGMDYYDLYRNININGFPTLWDYFAYLNAHPDEELRVIGKGPDVIETKKANLHNPDDYDDTSVICINSEGIYSKPCEDKKSDTERTNTDHTAMHYRKASPKVSAPKNMRSSYIAIQKQTSVMLTIAVILLFFFIVLNLAQIFSLAHKIEQLETEIENLKTSQHPYTVEIPQTPSTPDQDSFVEPVTAEITLTTSSEQEIYASSPVETTEYKNTQTEPAEEIRLSVSGVTTLFSLPDYNVPIVGYATTDSTVRFVSDREVDGVKWFNVELYPGVCGWAPDHWFSTATTP